MAMTLSFGLHPTNLNMYVWRSRAWFPDLKDIMNIEVQVVDNLSERPGNCFIIGSVGNENPLMTTTLWGRAPSGTSDSFIKDLEGKFQKELVFSGKLHLLMAKGRRGINPVPATNKATTKVGGFLWKSILLRHIPRQAGLRTFSCSICRYF